MAGFVKITDENEQVVFSGISLVDYVLWKDGKEEFLSHFWPFITEEKMDQVAERGIKSPSYNIKEDKFFYAKISEVDGVNVVDIAELGKIPSKYKILPFGCI